MTDLVNLLGMCAGAIWMSAAFYFQMIRTEAVNPAHVATLFLIGISLLLSSSAIAISNARLVWMFAVFGQTLFIALGLGAWWVLETHAKLREQQRLPDDNTSSP